MNLVFSGGGAKGISFIGALLELEKMEKLNFKNLAGTSAGSIVATLLAIGYTPKEMKKIMLEMDFDSIVDDNKLLNIYHFITSYGIAYGDYLYKTLGNIIKIKTNNPDYTFEELYKDKNINLVITATNLNKKNLVYLYHKNYPTMPIRQAIRMSTSVPFLFMPVIYNDEYYVDGGTLNDYIIEVFDGLVPDDIQTRYDGVPNPDTLGFKIIQKESSDNKIDHLYDYVYSFIESFLAENERKYLLKENLERTICIETPAYPLQKFNLTIEEKKHLINQGKLAVSLKFKAS